MSTSTSYFQASRHPFPSVLLVVFLLGLYEVAMQWLTARGLPAIRTGVDAWLGAGLARWNIVWVWAPSLCVMIVVLTWTVLAWKNEPQDLLSTLIGMTIECALAGIVLWGLFYLQQPFVKTCGLTLGAIRTALIMAQCASFIGAAVFEETLFRLIAFAGLAWALKLLLRPGAAVTIALLLSSAAFAAAHHYGTQGEPWRRDVFLFRILAGSYFAILYQFRGFGIAVGAHAAYDVLIGLAGHETYF